MLLEKENLPVHRYCGGPLAKQTSALCQHPSGPLLGHSNARIPPFLHTSRFLRISSFNQLKLSFMFFSSPFWCRESLIKVGFDYGWMALEIRGDAVVAGSLEGAQPSLLPAGPYPSVQPPDCLSPAPKVLW